MAKPRFSVSLDPDLYEVLKKEVAKRKQNGEKVSLADTLNEAANIVYADKVAKYRKQKLKQVAT